MRLSPLAPWLCGAAQKHLEEVLEKELLTQFSLHQTPRQLCCSSATTHTSTRAAEEGGASTSTNDHTRRSVCRHCEVEIAEDVHLLGQLCEKQNTVCVDSVCAEPSRVLVIAACGLGALRNDSSVGGNGGDIDTRKVVSVGMRAMENVDVGGEGGGGVGGGGGGGGQDRLNVAMQILNELRV